jgi:hypothetical protein
MRVRFQPHGTGCAGRTGRRTVSLALTLLGLVGMLSAACGKREAIAERPLKARGIGAAPAGPAQEPARPIDPQPWAAEPIAPTSPVEAPPVQDQPAEEKPPRDFNTELVQMIGSPAGCLKPRSAESAPSNIDISLSTSVMPSGAVAQSEVQAAGLDPSEALCLRSRLEALHFAAPIENAPFKARGTLHLTRATAFAPAQPANSAQRDREPAPILEARPAPSDLATGNPEVGAPALNAPDPP